MARERLLAQLGGELHVAARVVGGIRGSDRATLADRRLGERRLVGRRPNVGGLLLGHPGGGGADRRVAVDQHDETGAGVQHRGEAVGAGLEDLVQLEALVERPPDLVQERELGDALRGLLVEAGALDQRRDVAGRALGAGQLVRPEAARGLAGHQRADRSAGDDDRHPQDCRGAERHQRPGLLLRESARPVPHLRGVLSHHTRPKDGAVDLDRPGAWTGTGGPRRTATAARRRPRAGKIAAQRASQVSAAMAALC